MTNNFRPVESFVVAAASATTIPTSGTLKNSGGYFNLTNGQLGIVCDADGGSVALNSFTDATPTITEAPAIRFYQGTADSAGLVNATSTYPLSVRPFERTSKIDGRTKITVTKQAFRAPTYSTWIVGEDHGQADAINISDDTEYSLNIALRGRRIEEFFSRQQAIALTPGITTPNFTTLGKTTQEARKWLITQLAWQVNRQSSALNLPGTYPNNMPVLALAISVGGGAGTAIGGGSPIAAGDVVPVTTISGTNYSITLTDAMATSIKNAALAQAGGVIADLTWTIIPINLATAYDVSAADVDMLMLIGLDEKTSYVDYIPQVKTRLEVGLTRGFDYNTVQNAEWEQADEGQGDGRTLDLLYKATQGQRKYIQRHTEDPIVNYPSPIDVTQSYVVYNIMHGLTEQIDVSNTVTSPLRDIIAIPRYSSGTTAHAAIALVDTALNAYLASGNNGAIISLD